MNLPQRWHILLLETRMWKICVPCFLVRCPRSVHRRFPIRSAHPQNVPAISRLLIRSDISFETLLSSSEGWFSAIYLNLRTFSECGTLPDRNSDIYTMFTAAMIDPLSEKQRLISQMEGHQCVGRWHPVEPFPGSGKLSQDDAKVRMLEREVRELREENEIRKMVYCIGNSTP